MEGTFEVTLDGAAAGEAQLRREGLYTHIFCRCIAPERRIWRLFCGSERIGVLVPGAGGLVLETKVASRRLQKGCAWYLRDCAEPWHPVNFYPIREGEEFPALERVRQGVLAFQEGVPGLLLRDIHT